MFYLLMNNRQPAGVHSIGPDAFVSAHCA